MSSAPSKPLDERRTQTTADRIKQAIGVLLDNGGYHLPPDQQNLLHEISFKAGCLVSVLHHGDMDAAQVEALWNEERARSDAKLSKGRV